MTGIREVVRSFEGFVLEPEDIEARLIAADEFIIAV